MKFNDDTLMLFDLDTCLDYNTFDTIDVNYSDQFVDFACDDLEQFSNFSNNLNSIKTCSLIDEIDLFANTQTTTVETDFSSNNEFADLTDSLFNNSSSFNSSFNSPSFNSPSLNSPSYNTSSFNSSTTLNSSSSSNLSFNNSPSINSTNSNATSSSNIQPNNNNNNNSQDKRDVKKKLLDLTQRKLTHTLCFDNKLRNQVLLKSALKNVNSIDEDNLLGTKSKLDNDKSDNDKEDLNKFNKDKFNKDKSDQTDQNAHPKNTSPRKRNFKSNSSNFLNDFELFEEKIKKQKLSHLDEETGDYFIDENNFNYKDELTLNNLANCFIKLKHNIHTIKQQQTKIELIKLNQSI